jgi:hypothetical protein
MLSVGPLEWSAPGKPKDHAVSILKGTRCESESFILATSGSVRGRVVTPEGAPPSPQSLALIPVDENGNELSSALSVSVSSLADNGSYYFHDVVPGRYLLVVNPPNKSGKSDPVYPLMYYPGVMSRDAATVIVVLNGREMSLSDLMLTRPPKNSP